STTARAGAACPTAAASPRTTTTTSTSRCTDVAACPPVPGHTAQCPCEDLFARRWRGRGVRGDRVRRGRARAGGVPLRDGAALPGRVVLPGPPRLLTPSGAGVEERPDGLAAARQRVPAPALAVGLHDVEPAAVLGDEVGLLAPRHVVAGVGDGQQHVGV